MKITGSIKNIEMEIDKEEQENVTVSFINKLFDMKDSYYLENGNVCEDEEIVTSHVSYNQKIIRSANNQDKIYFEFMDLFYERLDQ